MKKAIYLIIGLLLISIVISTDLSNRTKDMDKVKRDILIDYSKTDKPTIELTFKYCKDNICVSHAYLKNVLDENIKIPRYNSSSEQYPDDELMDRFSRIAYKKADEFADRILNPSEDIIKDINFELELTEKK